MAEVVIQEVENYINRRQKMVARDHDHYGIVSGIVVTPDYKGVKTVAEAVLLGPGSNSYGGPGIGTGREVGRISRRGYG